MPDPLNQPSAFAQSRIDAVDVRVGLKDEVARKCCQLRREQLQDAWLVQVNVLFLHHLVVLDVLTVLLLKRDSAVASSASIARFNHHADTHIRLHEAFQVCRVHYVAHATNNFFVFLINFKHIFSTVLVGFAENLHLQRNCVDCLNVLLNCFNTERKHKVAVPVCDLLFWVVFERDP